MAGSVRDLRVRIKSVKNTQQITKAMKMVAAAKLRRAQEAVTEARPYAKRIQALVRGLSTSEAAASNPFFEPREELKVLLVVFSSDKGLAGAFNSNVIKQAIAFLAEKRAEGVAVEVAAIGRKVHEALRKRGYTIFHSEDAMMSRFTFEQSTALSDAVSDAFIDGTFDAVYGLFMEFRSAISQKPVVMKLLPFTGEEEIEPQDFLYEPGAAAVLNELLPRAVNASVYQFMLETAAGEHGSRMAAMDNASKNAKELVRALTLEMNRKRQAKITTEIIEIVSGASAL